MCVCVCVFVCVVCIYRVTTTLLPCIKAFLDYPPGAC